MSEIVDDYEVKMAAWRAKHGLNGDTKSRVNQEEVRMLAEDQVSKKSSWCFGCDKELPVKDMKIITRAIDPYT